MFRFNELVEQNIDALAHLPSSEHGKVIADFKATFSAGWSDEVRVRHPGAI